MGMPSALQGACAPFTLPSCLITHACMHATIIMHAIIMHAIIIMHATISMHATTTIMRYPEGRRFAVHCLHCQRGSQQHDITLQAVRCSTLHAVRCGAAWLPCAHPC